MKIAIIEYKRDEYLNTMISDAEELGTEVVSCIEYNPGDDIKKYTQLSNKEFDALVIIILENRFLESVLNVIRKLKIKNVFVPRLFAIDTRADFLHGLKKDDCGFLIYDNELLDKVDNEKPYFVHLETHVVDHCNLNCKACNNFSPFVKNPYYSDVAIFENDIARLASMYSGIGRFFLLGGEPLLAPDLCCKMIKVYRKYFPRNELRVLTNASLILKMNDDFWNVLRTEDVIIHISLYPPVKKDIKAIEERLFEKGIKYIIFREVTSFLKHWTEFPFEDEKYNNIRCGSAGCHFLRDGKIYKCPDAYLIGNVDGIGEALKSNDGISIYDNNCAQIIEKLLHPIDLCKKCSYKRAEKVIWEPIGASANIEDWFLPNKLEVEIAALNAELKDLKSQLNRAQTLNSKMKSDNDHLKALLDENRSQISALELQKSAAIEKLSNCLDEKKQLNDLIILKEEQYKEAVFQNEQEIKSFEKEIGDLINKANFFNEQYEMVNKSISYNLGLKLTFIPRKLYKMFVRNK